jgi:hypothetical protein
MGCGDGGLFHLVSLPPSHHFTHHLPTHHIPPFLQVQKIEFFFKKKFLSRSSFFGLVGLQK